MEKNKEGSFVNFSWFALPTGDSVLIPSDIELKIPEKTSFDANALHFLIYIPWDQKYLHLIDMEYREFFIKMLHYLHTRTTDVHIATCMPFIKEFVRYYNGNVDEKVAYVAFILHDSGWSHMSDEEIASSLEVTGLALTANAIRSKEKHAVLGRNIAMHVLEKETDAPQLNEYQKELIYDIILYHDKPWELAVNSDIPIEMKIVCDVDHLWSFTHENFWQDTVRKGVNPVSYLQNLKNDLASYFVTEKGQEKVKTLLYERKVEVEYWRRLVKRGS